MATAIVLRVKDTREACNSESSEAHNATKSQEVNVGADPAAVIQALQKIRCFVVPTDKYSQYRRYFLAREVLVKCVL